MSFFLPLRSLLKGWLISFLGWGIIALALGSHFVMQTGLPWGEATQGAVREWLPWAVATPLLFRFVGRLPIDRDSWRIALPVHLLVCVAVVAAFEWWSWQVRPDRWSNGHGPMFGEHHGPGDFGDHSGPPDFGRGHGPGDDGGLGPPGMPPSNFTGTSPDATAKGPDFPFHPGPGRHRLGGFFDLLRIVTFRLPIYFGIVSAAHAFVFFGRAQERERRSLGLEASLAKARLEALKMQLQPHFLFNSLNAIAELVHQEPVKAEEMLITLSDLLRLTLSTSGEQELSLARELEFVDRYLAIERVRYGDRLRVERDIAPDTRHAVVPAFVLQPLVENAVRHGLEPSTKAGVLTVRSRREDDTLHLSVADNGVGLPDGVLRREGIGLGNTRARLHELYGDAARLDLVSDGGVTVEISIPFRTAS